jgi:hypothetical protein
MTRATPKTLREVRKALTEDSIERKRLVDRLVQLVREDERERVLGITHRAAQAER